VAQLAHHFRKAGDTESWARYAEQAAEIATAAGDWVTAATLLHGLLSSTDLAPAAVAPLTAKIPPGVLSSKSSVEDVAHALRAALDSGELDTGQVAFARYQLGIVLGYIDFDGGIREMELAVPHLEPGSYELLDAMTYLGWPLGSTRSGRVHRDWLRRAAQAARSVPPEDQPDIAVKRAVALLLLDEPEGWAVAAAMTDDVSTPMQRRNVALRDRNLGELAMRWGRYEEARSRLGKALSLADAYGFPLYREGVCACQPHLDWFTGDWDGLAERAAEIAGAGEMLPLNRLQGSLVTGLMLAADGRYAEAECVLRQVLAQMRDLEVYTSVEPAAALARVYLTTGRVAEALAVTEDPIGVVALKETWLWATDLAPARVEALVAVGRLDDAEELVAAFADGVRGRDAPAPRAAAIVCEGILAAGRGEPTGAAAAFARAADAWDALPRPYDALLARERQAHCLLATGSNEAGLELLAGVCQGLAELGARGDADRVLRELKEREADTGPRRRGRPGYGDRLSPRELVLLPVEVTNSSSAASTFVSAQGTAGGGGVFEATISAFVLPGTYSATAFETWIADDSEQSYATVPDPQISVTGDTEVTLDARKAKEITFTTPRPAQRLLSTVNVERTGADGFLHGTFMSVLGRSETGTTSWRSPPSGSPRGSSGIPPKHPSSIRRSS
jgi:tetratricopeptide (TPR) repeat protein